MADFPSRVSTIELLINIQDNNLLRLPHFRIPETKLKFVAGERNTVEVDGDVRRAEIKRSWWRFWTAPEVVAVKNLRLSGG